MREIINLKASGLVVSWIKITSSMYPESCTSLDAPAEAAVQNIVQLNGFFSHVITANMLV